MDPEKGSSYRLQSGARDVHLSLAIRHSRSHRPQFAKGPESFFTYKTLDSRTPKEHLHPGPVLTFARVLQCVTMRLRGNRSLPVLCTYFASSTNLARPVCFCLSGGFVCISYSNSLSGFASTLDGTRARLAARPLCHHPFISL